MLSCFNKERNTLNLHFVFNFIRHYLSATLIDVLHSPFVFGLYQTCIKRQDANDYKIIEQLRTELKNNPTELFYSDFGASQKSRKTTLNKLAKQHLKPARIAQILARMASKYPHQTYLELGTSLGISTCYLAKFAATNAKIYTIEACEPVREVALQNFKVLGLQDKIESELGNFDEVLPELLPKIGKLDFFFIDGNHSYEATLRYFEMAKPYLHNDSVIVFDDIYWSKGMTQAWQAIKADPMVRVSVDLFFVGMVFFRKEQVKEAFQLRIL